MAFDAFIRIDGIEGESGDDKHAGWTEVSNFSLGAALNEIIDEKNHI